jgi:hypothetical protein
MNSGTLKSVILFFVRLYFHPLISIISQSYWNYLIWNDCLGKFKSYLVDCLLLLLDLGGITLISLSKFFILIFDLGISHSVFRLVMRIRQSLSSVFEVRSILRVNYFYRLWSSVISRQLLMVYMLILS